MKVYIEAFNDQDQQVLGNLDGQGVINAKNYQNTLQYKDLPFIKTLNDSIKYFRIVTISDFTLEIVPSQTYKEKTNESVQS